jgi:hypothetical protein
VGGVPAWGSRLRGSGDRQSRKGDPFGEYTSPHFAQVLSTTASPKVVSLDELDEWEECSSLDDDCELVEIDEEDEEDEEDEVFTFPASYHFL